MSEVREFAVDTPRGCSELSTRVHIRGGTWLRSNAPFQGPKRRAARAGARLPGRGPPGPSRPLAARGRGGGGVLSVSPAPGAWCRSCTTAPGSSLHALPRRRGLPRRGAVRGARSAGARHAPHTPRLTRRATHTAHTHGEGWGPPAATGPARRPPVAAARAPPRPPRRPLRAVRPRCSGCGVGSE